MIKKLTENNFLQFALNNYDNPSCATLEEFEDDLKKFLYPVSYTHLTLPTNREV